MAVFSSGIHSAPALEPELVTTSPTSTTVTSADSALPAQPLAIEAPPASDTIKLDVGTSEPVSLFDQLGPMIVSKEGVSPPHPAAPAACTWWARPGAN